MSDRPDDFVPDWEFSIEETPKMGKPAKEKNRVVYKYCYICGVMNNKDSVYTKDDVMVHLPCYHHHVKVKP